MAGSCSSSELYITIHFTAVSCSLSVYSEVFDAFWGCRSCSSSVSSEFVSKNSGVFSVFLSCFDAGPCSSSVSSESVSTNSGVFGAF